MNRKIMTFVRKKNLSKLTQHSTDVRTGSYNMKTVVAVFYMFKKLSTDREDMF